MGMLFGGGKKNEAELPPITTTDSAVVQESATEARRLAALAKGRKSTDIVSRLGNVGRA